MSVAAPPRLSRLRHLSGLGPSAPAPPLDATSQTGDQPPNHCPCVRVCVRVCVCVSGRPSPLNPLKPLKRAPARQETNPQTINYGVKPTNFHFRMLVKHVSREDHLTNLSFRLRKTTTFELRAFFPKSGAGAQGHEEFRTMPLACPRSARVSDGSNGQLFLRTAGGKISLYFLSRKPNPAIGHQDPNENYVRHFPNGFWQTPFLRPARSTAPKLAAKQYSPGWVWWGGGLINLSDDF